MSRGGKEKNLLSRVEEQRVAAIISPCCCTVSPATATTLSPLPPCLPLPGPRLPPRCSQVLEADAGGKHEQYCPIKKWNTLGERLAENDKLLLLDIK